MPISSKIAGLWKNLFRKPQVEHDLDDELRAYIEELTARKIQAGMDPQSARRSAMIEAGGVEQIKERVREERVGFTFDSLTKDIAYAVRGFRRSPGFVFIVILLLALGIGANTALFSVLDAALLRKLPVENPDDLVLLEWTPGTGGWSIAGDDYAYGGWPFTYPSFEAMRLRNETLTHLFAIQGFKADIRLDGQAEVVEAQRVSGNYYAGLGVRALLGRTLAEDDDKPGAEPVAVISHRYWKRRFALDPTVFGKTVLVDNVPVTVVGVTPPEFHGTGGFGHSPDFSLPLAEIALTPGRASLLTNRVTSWVFLMGRLKPGVSSGQARANLEPALRESVDKGMSLLHIYSGSRGADSLILNLGGFLSNSSNVVAILAVAFGLLLLIGCVNVSNLMLVRAVTRQQEIGIRSALGASRSRLVRQLLSETLLLALFGGVLGVLFALWGKDLLWAYFPGSSRIADDLIDFRIDYRVLAFTAFLSLVTGVLFGIVPALRTSRTDLNSVIKGNPRNFTVTRSRFSKSLLIMQVAMAVVLVVSGGLFVRTFQDLAGDYGEGLDVNNVLRFRVDASTLKYDAKRIAFLQDQLVERINSVPGVVETTLWRSGPHSHPVDFLVVRNNFIETFGIPIVLGQDLPPTGKPGGPRSVVINEAMARQEFPDISPIGRQLSQIEIFPDDDHNKPEVMKEPYTVVGVAKDVRIQPGQRNIQPTFYVADFETSGPASFAIRTSGNPAALIAPVREAIREVDPNLPIPVIRPLAEQIADTVAGFESERALAAGVGFFGALGLLMVSIGLYGVTSYNVARRTNEIGIRMALGARRRNVAWLVQKDLLRIAAIGGAIGLSVAAPLTRLIRSQIFGLRSFDAGALVVALLLLLAVSALAGYLPARRAARVDPMGALRTE